MKIAFNPSTVAALTTPPNNKDITFDLRGRNIFTRGVKFYGTDTNTWRDIKINNVSIGSHTLDLRNGSNTTLTNTNGVVTINSTWRPVVDNLTSDSTTSSLSAKQGKVLKALIDGKSNSDHNHDGRYVRYYAVTTLDCNNLAAGLTAARISATNAAHTNHSAYLYISDVGTPFQIQIPDSSIPYIYKRYYGSGKWSGWFKLNAGYADSAGSVAWANVTGKPSSYTPSAHTHAWNSLTHSSTAENQAILTNGEANGWKLQTLNIARWDNAANNAHSHANKSVLDGITSALVNSWNTAYNFVSNITGTDTDKVINKWEEIVNFLAGITEDNKLNTLLNSKLSVYELANNTNVGTIKNNGIYYSTTDASSGTLTNSPFNTGFALINMTSYDGGDDLRRPRLAFNAYGEIKVSDDRDQANTAETWYNVLTSKNSGINGSTIKLNGTSITVYSSGTADGRYVKKSGDTMQGVLTIDTTNFGALTIKRNDDANGASIQFRGKSSVYGYIGLNNSTKDKQFLRWSSDTSKIYTILDTSSTYISNGKGVINGTTITQVDNATNSTNSTNARKLVNWYSARPTSLNAQFGDGSLRIFYATSSTTEGKSPSDAAVLHLAWDNNSGWDSQLAISNSLNRVYSRSQNNGTWQPWKTLAFTTDIPTSLKNPYSFNVFGVVYDGSAAKTVTTSNFISQVNEGTSTITDGTMLITSYASNSGFADTNAVNVPYKRKAIHLWEYIKAKTDSLYATKVHNHDGSVTLHQYLSATDAAWYPLVWGGNAHNNTGDFTGAVYKSYDKLSWQTSSQTLYATNIQTNNIKSLSVGGGIYWNPYVEATTDNTDAASITLVRQGVAGGTTLVLSQMNDTNDTIQFKTNTAARLYHNSYPILTTQNTYVSNNKGYINGTEITQVNNSDKVDNRHAISTTPNTGIIYKAAIYTAYSLTSYWVRLASIPSISQNGEFVATIHVQSGHSGFGRNAILLVYLRGGASSYLAKGFNICCNSNYDPNRFRLYYKDSDKTSEIWYNTVGQWDGIITTVISQSSEGSLYEGLTLYSGIITAVQTPSMSTYLSAQVSTITDNISGNASSATNADMVDGYHENSFLRYRGATYTDQESTLWSQIGIKQYNNALPDNLTGVYNYGSVISLPGFNSRFEIYASHQSSNGNGLYYRSGWDNDKKAWLKFIDSSNIGSQSVNYANSAGHANSAGNADTLGGIPRNYGQAPFGTIPSIGNDGVMEIGRYIDFHSDNSGSYDYSTRIQATGNYKNTVNLPSASGTLALTSYGGDDSTPIFLGCLNLYHGGDGTISSSFYCLGYSVSFTYTRGGNYCKIFIPDTTRLSFYIIAAIASVNYSGGGMDTWVGEHRGDGAWWLHCQAFWNEVRVKGFRPSSGHNDGWWGGNPLYSGIGGANQITVCIFGHVKYR